MTLSLMMTQLLTFDHKVQCLEEKRRKSLVWMLNLTYWIQRTMVSDRGILIKK